MFFAELEEGEECESGQLEELVDELQRLSFTSLCQPRKPTTVNLIFISDDLAAPLPLSKGLARLQRNSYLADR